MNRLEQRKNSIEKTLKDFKIPYTTKCARRFFYIRYHNLDYKLEVSNKYIALTNSKNGMYYGFFEEVTDFRYIISNNLDM